MQEARCLALFALAACAYAIAPDGAAMAQHRETLDVVSRFHGKPLQLPVQVYLPDKVTGGKTPAMIISHGSGGVRSERELAYAREFLALGIAAVVIDSYSPRGVKTTVRDQDAVVTADMLMDAAATLKAVARHPAIDAARIGLIGFSKGGTVAIKAALQRYMKPLAGDDAAFALLIALYPWCGDQPLDFRPASKAPLHMLLGAQDRYVGTESCEEYGRKFQAQGGNASVKIYAGAQHDWDFPGSGHWTLRAGQNHSKCIYDETEPGVWYLRGTRIKVADHGKPTGELKKARARCMTLGVSGGYSKLAHDETLRDIRGYVRKAFDMK